ncbi:hypothetical protein IE81DRAFT_316316 [Ceraceosorus guamensis]|uniref:Ribosomal RNA-processing protein 7 C-terminal domain-containing protein n=1 Tax=Ceraceosorus guamensis TaxID=1522189 RepID=A0A316VT66_9BASI|nr:hypothetical protein IE81DRAFT_316316 [Ceraceosorus guamensis]PWN40682.1 hypothetical protein IE81DRAFT_316316 [Ceraceosorus guamensis]
MARSKSKTASRAEDEARNSSASHTVSKKNKGAAGFATVSGFRVLRLGSQVLYIRIHQEKGRVEATTSQTRTLFVVNLPTDTTDRHVRAIFAKAGPIEVVQFWNQSPGSVSEDEDGMDAGGPDEGFQEQAGSSTSAATSSNVGKHRGGKKSSGPPAIVPLPPSDPRHPHRLHGTSVSAHVTFLDASCAQRALSLPDSTSWPDAWADIRNAQSAAALAAMEDSRPHGQKKRPGSAGQAALEAGQSVPPLGLEYFVSRYRAQRPTPDAITKHVDSVIAHYTWVKEHPQAKDKGGVPVASYGPDGEMLDEDGFTIVQRGGRFGRTAEGGADASGFKSGPAARGSTVRENGASGSGKKKSKELEDFYRFQIREKKREQLASLREQFEKDKQKVEKLKNSRRFNPY